MAAWPSCGGRSPPCDRVRPPRDAWSAVVRRVVDGDTVILLARGRSVRVRLIGADAPELWYRRDCDGAEAARGLRALLPPGSQVRAAGDRDAVDRYGRRLLYLWTLGRRAHAGAVTTRSAVGTATVRAGKARAGAGTAHPDPGTARTPTFVAVWLIRAGLARAMYVPPNARYAAAMRAAETAARRSRAGLWSACAGR
jgi:micrococcal nuclease